MEGSSSEVEKASFSVGAAEMLVAGDPVASSPPASEGDGGLHCSHLARMTEPFVVKTASAAVFDALGAAVYNSARVWTPAGELLEATSKGCHHGICQLDRNTPSNCCHNLIGDD